MNPGAGRMKKLGWSFPIGVGTSRTGQAFPMTSGSRIAARILPRFEPSPVMPGGAVRTEFQSNSTSDLTFTPCHLDGENGGGFALAFDFTPVIRTPQ